MDIKMRVVKTSDCVCKLCGTPRNKCLDIFEIKFTEKAKLQICDLCNEKLFYKTLKASCYVNGRLKDKKDMQIINKRSIEGCHWYNHKDINPTAAEDDEDAAEYE